MKAVHQRDKIKKLSDEIKETDFGDEKNFDRTIPFHRIE
jgi:hypothetical protein